MNKWMKRTIALVLMVLILVSMFIMNRFADNSGEGGLVA